MKNPGQEGLKVHEEKGNQVKWPGLNIPIAFTSVRVMKASGV